MMNLDHRRQIARKLQALVVGLEFNEVQRYISLTIGTAPYKGAISVSKVQDKISFYIENQSLLDEIRKSGFRIGLADQAYLYNKDRYWLYEVGASESCLGAWPLKRYGSCRTNVQRSLMQVSRE